MTLETLREKFAKFERMNIIFIAGRGHLAWRYGSGGNVEIFDIEAYVKRRGVGRTMIRELVKILAENPPHSMFGFTAAGNVDAQDFYRALGFWTSTEIGDLYRRGARLFVIKYKKAKKI